MPDNYAYLSEVFAEFPRKNSKQTFGNALPPERVWPELSDVKVLKERVDTLDTKVNVLEQKINNPQEDTPPTYDEQSESLQRQLHVLNTLQPYNRLKRNANNEIELETRFKTFRKADSRWTALEDLRNIMSRCDSSEKDIVQNAVRLLIDTTYKHDSNWVGEAEKLLQSTKL